MYLHYDGAVKTLFISIKTLSINFVLFSIFVNSSIQSVFCNWYLSCSFLEEFRKKFYDLLIASFNCIMAGGPNNPDWNMPMSGHLSRNTNHQLKSLSIKAHIIMIFCSDKKRKILLLLKIALVITKIRECVSRFEHQTVHWQFELVWV